MTKLIQVHSINKKKKTINFQSKDNVEIDPDKPIYIHAI